MKFISSQRAPSLRCVWSGLALAALLVASLFGGSAFAQMAQQSVPRRLPGPIQPPLLPVVHHGGEDSLAIPSQIDTLPFFGMAASKLLMLGLGVSALGVLFGMVVYVQLKNLPVHKSMRDVSELIYETCKTYLFTQA
jgi:hypothetical protein